jgi:hypothetical protein
MGELTADAIPFETSRLVAPALVARVSALPGGAILVRGSACPRLAARRVQPGRRWAA